MQKEHLPIYQIQDFNALTKKEQYFYFSTFSAHLQEHLFIREPHKHNFYIILVVTQGSGTHTIDFRDYTVNPGSVFFLAPGQVHSWQLSDDVDGFVVFFSKEFYAKEHPYSKLFDFPFFNALLHRPILDLSQDEMDKFIPVFDSLQEEYKAVRVMKEVMLSRLLDILLIGLTRIYQRQDNTTAVKDKDRYLLQTLESLIDQHYKEHLPVGYYAERLHVTTKHLNEVCKRSVGKTTIELIQYRTLLEAKRLLVHAALTSSQIAAELGYFDNAYFFRFFKKHTGITPEQFRAANK